MRWTWWAVGLFVAITGAALYSLSFGTLHRWIFDEYRYNLELTLTMPAPDGTMQRAQSVMEVRLNDRNTLFGRKFGTGVRGEMPFIQMPDGTYVFALIYNTYGEVPAIMVRPYFDPKKRREITYTFKDLGREHGYNNMQVSKRFNAELAEAGVALLKTGRTICGGEPLFPHLVVFDDLSDPTTIRRVHSTGACLTARITDSDLSERKVEEVLTWLATMSVQDKLSQKLPINEEDIGKNITIGGHIIGKRHFIKHKG